MTLQRREFLLVGVAAMVGLAACGNPDRGYFADSTTLPAGSTPIDGAPKAITSIVMVGDSLTQGSTDELTATFEAAGITVIRIDAERGRRIEVGNGKGSGPLSGRGTVYNLLAEGLTPDAWVIALGTNDVGSYPSPDAYGTLIDSLLALLPAPLPLVWVNVDRPQYDKDTIVFNLVLKERLDRRGRAVVADWFTLASDPNTDLLRSDDLHPNTEGQKAFALLTVDAVKRL
jgi:lysophospholipase L1-like esterase